MTKKIVTVLLACALLCVAAFAAAQSETIRLADVGESKEAVLVLENPVTVNFDLEDVPAGFVYARVSRAGVADVYIVIAPSEVAEGMSLADLGEEGVAVLQELIGEQYADPIYETKTSPSGNLYLEVCSNEEESEIDTMLTLFEGYLIELDVYRDDFSKLSDEDKAFAEEILYALWINETAE